MPQDHNPKALAMADRLFPTVGRKRLDWLADMDPGFCRLFEDYVYAGLYQRGILDQKTRELCAVAALTSLSQLQQLATHVRAALLAGASRDEIQEVIFQASVYAGFPATLVALQEMRKVFAELDASA